MTEFQTSVVPRVFVFGGGIAGLTAAHELAVRGFRVIVCEKERDYFSEVNRLGCSVGGMARSQWARVPFPPPAQTFRAIRAPNAPLKSWLQLNIVFNGNDSLTTTQAEEIDAFARGPEGLEPVGGIQIIVVRDPAKAPRSQDALLSDPRISAVRDRFKEKKPGVSEQLHGFDGSGKDYKDTVVLVRQESVIPAEHGFRFFPSFYRHVFDTMKRIPLLTSRSSERRGGPYDDSRATVYDNLLRTDATWLSLEGDESCGFQSMPFRRSPAKGIREAYDRIMDTHLKLGYSASDAYQLVSKMMQYMTSGRLRRERELEDMSWWDFIDGDKLSERAGRHMDHAPQILGAMVSRMSDARTQGSASAQLMLDQIRDDARTDATLNGPTSAAWFHHWHVYLKKLGVRFHPVTLTGFKATAGRIVPVIDPDPDFGFDPDASLDSLDYYVVATDLPALIGAPGKHSSQRRSDGLAAAFVAQAEANGLECGDFRKIATWDIPDWNSNDDRAKRGALQHLVGIQFYFRVDDFSTVGGHTLYLDSPWRLSAISQTQFWSAANRIGAEAPPYSGVLSIDIGNLREGATRPEEFGAIRDADEKWRTPAWNRTYDELFDLTLLQVRGRSWYDASLQGGGLNPFGLSDDVVPDVTFYHIDQSVEFSADKKPVRNAMPYLVNTPGEWSRRPGRLPVRRNSSDASGYELQAGNWVIAGTHMKTFTRLTTMEAANESGRHAANAIIADAQKRRAMVSDMARIWDPEELEHDDLRWFKELDDQLCDRGMPTAIEIIERFVTWRRRGEEQT